MSSSMGKKLALPKSSLQRSSHVTVRFVPGKLKLRTLFLEGRLLANLMPTTAHH